MPWCDHCERFSNPNSLSADGACPACGTVIAEAGGASPEGSVRSGLRSVPWHFWLLLIALVVYLGWRFVQGIAWLIGRF